MKKESILKLIGKTVFIKRKNGYRYKATLIEVSDEDLTFRDRDTSIRIVSLDDITEISEWRDKKGVFDDR